MRRFLSIAVASVMMAACGDGTPDERDPMAVTPVCSSSFSEPVLNIRQATDAATGAMLAEVAITELKIDAAAVNGIELDHLVWPGHNVRTGNGSLVCTLPCQFSHREGRYEFSVSATGYAKLPVALDVRYAQAAGECPVVLSGATETQLRLAQDK